MTACFLTSLPLGTRQLCHRPCAICTWLCLACFLFRLPGSSHWPIPLLYLKTRTKIHALLQATRELHIYMLPALGFSHINSPGMSEMIRKTHLTSPDSDDAQHVKLARASCGLSREMSVPGQQRDHLRVHLSSFLMNGEAEVLRSESTCRRSLFCIAAV